MSQQDQTILSSVERSAQLLKEVQEILSSQPSLTKETSTQVRDLMIEAQTALNQAFPLLKTVRRDLFLLQPQS